MKPILLIQDNAVDWQARVHFYAVASIVMRPLLMDHVRKRVSAERPGARQRVELGDFLASQSPRIEKFLILDEDRTHLAEMDALQASVVELIYLGGRTEERVAGALGISGRTVKHDWRGAHAWPQAELERQRK
jgi:RNA polymerase sigma factor (TIGR02999 family)